VTPEAPDLATALGGKPPQRVLRFDRATLLSERDRLSTAHGDQLDVVAIGSPHFSLDEFSALRALLVGRSVCLPFYVCTGRHVLDELAQRGWLAELEDAGVTLLVDTCVVVTSVLGSTRGILMTNSGKFAHYSDSLISHSVVFGTLEDCVESAIAGRVCRDPAPWGAAA
jgi:predicted aconitase